MKALCAVLLFLLAALLSGTGARAHALDPGFLELQALGGDTWRVLWRVPQVGGEPMPLGLVLPQNCTPRDGPPFSFDGRAFVSQWVVSCPGGLQGGRIDIPGLDATQTDVLVRYDVLPGTTDSMRLTATSPGFDVPAPLGFLGVLTTYGALGINHILTGVDHLLFVFVLLLLIRDVRTLIGAVTAFTVGHSLSLAAAALGWIVLPSPPVEAVVALSIMFLAAELTQPQGRGFRLTERYPWTVAFGFGLLHGLGFARALLDLGLPQSDVPLALLAFNLGVEAGQLMFILFVTVAGLLLARLYPAMMASATRRGRAGAHLIGYIAGGIAGTWFIARLALF